MDTSPRMGKITGSHSSKMRMLAGRVNKRHLEYRSMQAVRSDRRLVWGLTLALVAALAAWSTRSLAADPQPASGGAAGSSRQDSVKIEPYKGPPVYLEETPQVAKATIVTHQTIPEKY